MSEITTHLQEIRLSDSSIVYNLELRQDNQVVVFHLNATDLTKALSQSNRFRMFMDNNTVTGCTAV